MHHGLCESGEYSGEIESNSYANCFLFFFLFFLQGEGVAGRGRIKQDASCAV